LLVGPGAPGAGRSHPAAEERRRRLRRRWHGPQFQFVLTTTHPPSRCRALSSSRQLGRRCKDRAGGGREVAACAARGRPRVLEAGVSWTRVWSTSSDHVGEEGSASPLEHPAAARSTSNGSGSRSNRSTRQSLVPGCAERVMSGRCGLKARSLQPRQRGITWSPLSCSGAARGGRLRARLLVPADSRQLGLADPDGTRPSTIVSAPTSTPG